MADSLNIEDNFVIDLFNTKNTGIFETQKNFHTVKGYGSFKKIAFKNIHICYGDVRINKDYFLGIAFTEPVIEMHFLILGSSSLTAENGNEYHFCGNQHNLIFCPDKEYLVSSPDEKETSYSLHIIFSEDYFLSLIHEVYPVMNSFKKAMLLRNFTMLAKNNMPIVPEMNSILQEIIGCKRKGMLKSLFMEAKTIKLLMLQLEQFEQMEYHGTTWLKDHDIDKIHLVKSIMDENVSHPFSLIELSRLAGINDFKLKKGFKEIYGNTVFGYLKDIRMLNAKKMLLENDKSISDIAMLCGYKFVQNFTKAFKKEFGITPDKFRS